MLRRTVTDEGSPLTAGLNAARTFVILWLAAGAEDAPAAVLNPDAQAVFTLF